MLTSPLPPSGCVGRGKQGAGNRLHPSRHPRLASISIAHCGLCDTNSSGQLYPFNSLVAKLPDLAHSQGTRRCCALREARPEVGGCPARANTPMLYSYRKQAFKGLASLDNDHLITDHCGHRRRLLPANLMDCIRTPGFCTTWRTGRWGSPCNGGGFIPCLSYGKGSWNKLNFT